MSNQLEETIVKPLCPECGHKTNARGWETFSEIPHKRRKFTCTECGYTFVPGSKKRKKVKFVDEVKVSEPIAVDSGITEPKNAQVAITTAATQE